MTTSWQIKAMPHHTPPFLQGATPSGSSTSNSAYGRWFPSSATGVTGRPPTGVDSLTTARRLGVLSAPSPDGGSSSSHYANTGQWGGPHYRAAIDDHNNKLTAESSTRFTGKLNSGTLPPSLQGDHHGHRERSSSFYNTPDASDIALFKRKVQAEMKENYLSNGHHHEVKQSPRDRQTAAVNTDHDVNRTVGYNSQYNSHRPNSFSNNLLNGSATGSDANRWYPLSTGVVPHPIPTPPEEPRSPYRSIVGIQRSTTTLGTDPATATSSSSSVSPSLARQHSELSLKGRVIERNGLHQKSHNFHAAAQQGDSPITNKLDDFSVRFIPSRPIGLDNSDVRRPLSNGSDNGDGSGTIGNVSIRQNSLVQQPGSRYWMYGGSGSSRHMGEVRSRIPSLQHRGSFVYQLELGKNNEERGTVEPLENGDGPLCLSLSRGDAGQRSAQHDSLSRGRSLTADDLEAFRIANADYMSTDNKGIKGHVLLYSPKTVTDPLLNRVSSNMGGTLPAPKSILKKQSKYGPPLPATYSTMTGRDMALLAQDTRIQSGSMRRSSSPSTKRVTFRLL